MRRSSNLGRTARLCYCQTLKKISGEKMRPNSFLILFMFLSATTGEGDVREVAAWRWYVQDYNWCCCDQVAQEVYFSIKRRLNPHLMNCAEASISFIGCPIGLLNLLHVTFSDTRAPTFQIISNTSPHQKRFQLRKEQFIWSAEWSKSVLHYHFAC